MKVYIASSWRNGQPAVVAALRAAGHEVYDFRNPAPGNTGFSWREACEEPLPWSAEVAQDGLRLDYDAMQWADAIVMVQPCGRSAALELGWGVGAGKLTIVLLADGQEPELMFRLARYLCTRLDEVIGILDAHGNGGDK